MSKVDTAIKQAYETLNRMTVKDPTVMQAMEQLKPFYENPGAVFDEERRQWWLDQMEIHFDGHFKKFTEEQKDKMVEWLLEWDADNEDIISDALFGALRDNGLIDLVYGE